MPRRPTGSSSRSTWSRRSQPSPRSPAGTASASSCRPTRSARGSCSTGWSTLGAAARPAPHGAPGQGRLLGQRDQARAGRRPGRLPGLHPQGPHRRRLPRLRQGDAGGTRAIYPQFATHNALTLAAVHELAGAQPTWSSSACTAWARALRRGGRRGQARSAPAASTRRSARTRRCSPISCGACSRTARTPRSSTASSTRRSRSTSWSPIRSRMAERTAARRTPRIPLPRDLCAPERANSQGIDLADEHDLAALEQRLAAAPGPWTAAPDPRRQRPHRHGAVAIRNPADRDDEVGTVRRGRARRGRRARWRCAVAAQPAWAALRSASARHASSAPPTSSRPSARRCVALAVREAGKTLPNAIGEVREAVDFLPLLRRAQARAELRPPARTCCARPGRLHPPWNFPLAIFTGEVAAALAAGNAGAGQARRADAADRRRGRAAAASRRRARRRRSSSSRATATRSARRWPPTRASRASSSPARPTSRAADQPRARRTRGDDPVADRRDRRPERDDRRQLRARRAGRRRRAGLGLRQRRPALLGAARAVPAGGRGRAHASRCWKAPWTSSRVGDPRCWRPTSAR